MKRILGLPQVRREMPVHATFQLMPVRFNATCVFFSAISALVPHLLQFHL